MFYLFPKILLLLCHWYDLGDIFCIVQNIFFKTLLAPLELLVRSVDCIPNKLYNNLLDEKVIKFDWMNLLDFIKEVVIFL